MSHIETALNTKEAEAIMWIAATLVDCADIEDQFLADDDIVRRLRQQGFTDEQVLEEGKRLEDIAATRILPTRLTPIQTEALKEAVERTTWIECYAEDTLRLAGPDGLDEALRTLRELAAKLEQRDIEVLQLAFTEYGGPEFPAGRR